MMAQVLGRRWILCIVFTMYLQACLAGELEETKEITEKLAALKPRAVTPEYLFSITKGGQFTIVSKLPSLGPWMKKKVKNSYKINDEKLFKVLEKSANLLRVISLSCEGYDCKVDVVSLQSRYQDVLTSLERACYLLYKDALMSVKESKIGILSIKRGRSWNAAKQMNRMLKRQKTRIQNRKEKLRPILKQLSPLLQKVPRVIGESKKKASVELETQTTLTKILKEELKNLEDAIDKLSKDIKDYEASIPKLKSEKESKIKQKETLMAKIDKRRDCVKKRQDKRSKGPSYWITAHSKDGKYALRASTLPVRRNAYSANVENKEGIKTSGNADYAQMHLELQDDGKYKIFSKKHGGVLYCRKGRSGKAYTFFSKDPEHEGGERWEINVHENPVFTIYNSDCRNDLCVTLDKASGEGKAMVSACTEDGDNREWRILEDGVDEYESEETLSTSPSPTQSDGDTEQKKYTCPTFKPGYGNVDTVQEEAARMTAEECVKACTIKSKTDPTINAVSIETRDPKMGKCFCQSLVTEIDPFSNYKTCYLSRAEETPKKLKPQELPTETAVDCGEKIDEDDLETLSQEISRIGDRISSTDLDIGNKKYERQMKNIEIRPKKRRLKTAEGAMTQAKEAIDRLSRASEVFVTFLKAMCELNEYIKVWKVTFPSEKTDTTAVIPAPSQRDQTIRYGYTWLAYGLATYKSYKNFGPPKEAATKAFIENSSADEKKTFLSTSEELVKETTQLVNDYATSRSICKQ